MRNILFLAALEKRLTKALRRAWRFLAVAFTVLEKHFKAACFVLGVAFLIVYAQNARTGRYVPLFNGGEVMMDTRNLKVWILTKSNGELLWASRDIPKRSEGLEEGLDFYRQ